MLSTEIWQMCPKCHECSCIASIEVASITEEKKNDDCSYPLSFATSPDPSTVSTMSESSVPNFVYSRRRLRGNSVAIFSAQAPASTKRSIEDSVSVISSDTPSVTVKEQHVVSQGEPSVGAPIMPCMVLQGEPRVFQSESINRCSLVEERGSDEASKNSSQKIVEVDSINDSCSSSKSDMELVSASVQTEADETGECSSSSVMIVEASGEDLSENDLCVSIIRSQGHEGVLPSRTRTSAEGVVDSSASSNSRSCKICANPESTLKMLICDNCEEAFHLSCCNPRVKRIPLDEWFCHSCSKKRRKILKEAMSRRYPNMIGEKGTCGNSSKDELNPIALMLRDTGSYTSGVRIGKGFQAEVPDWSGPITKDVDTIGEALEMDPSDFLSLMELKSNKPKLGSIGNWLQCREVIDGAGESTNATICGKWRRAPLFEVQTDDWECSCSVLWDPIHADCAVPQELDTDQILKQLKYIQMLRPRLIAKRRKFDHSKNDDDSKDSV